MAAIHLETGRSAWLNPDVAFPMASTYKVPIAVQLLTMVDEGRLSLDSMVTVPQEDVYRTASTISDLLNQPGLSLSVRNLMELMLRVSDNIATDVLFRTAGGSQAITDRMRAVGFKNIRVDRPTWALIAGLVGRPDVTEQNRIYPEDYLELLRRQRSEEEQAAHVQAFNVDPRDTATPKDMGELLVRLWKGEILSRRSTDLLLDIMPVATPVRLGSRASCRPARAWRTRRARSARPRTTSASSTCPAVPATSSPWSTSRSRGFRTARPWSR